MHEDQIKDIGRFVVTLIITLVVLFCSIIITTLPKKAIAADVAKPVLMKPGHFVRCITSDRVEGVVLFTQNDQNEGELIYTYQGKTIRRVEVKAH
jgi:hypothetical protein